MAVSYTDWGADPPARPVPEPPTSAAVAEPRARPSETLKLLCLHGWRSNRRVTSLQLSNLGLHVDPDYGGDGALARLVAPTLIDGPVRSSRAYDTLLGEMFAPPWCSWVDGADGPEHDTPAGLAMLREACEHVLDVCAREGPFDGAYGFSQGALVVTLLCSPAARASLGVREPGGGGAGTATAPFRFAILACGAAPPASLASHDLAVPSLHIIGAEDHIRARSRTLRTLWQSGGSSCETYEGAFGHAIPMGFRFDRKGRAVVEAFLLSRKEASAGARAPQPAAADLERPPKSLSPWAWLSRALFAGSAAVVVWLSLSS